jgi:hypothetical protein
MTKQSLGLRKSRLFYMFYSILRKRGRANFDTASFCVQIQIIVVYLHKTNVYGKARY